jgi:energy-coupling factor transporter ATP-binding protein EcfA2
MRLAGFVHASALTGGESLWIELADLTVVLGANDTGKSRSLVALHEYLRHLGTPQDRSENPPPLTTPDFEGSLYALLDPEEAILAPTSILYELVADDEMEPSDYGTFGGLPFSAFDPSFIHDLSVDEHVYDEGAPRVWIELARRSVGLTEARYDPLFRALEESRIVEVERQNEGDSLLSVSLCLGADAARAEPVSALLTELGMMTDSDWPISVMPFGDLRGGVPTPTWVPQQVNQVVERVIDGVVDGVKAEALLQSGEPPESYESAEILDVLLQPAADDPFTVTISPSFRAFCGLAQMLANEVLPSFIRDEYWLSIESSSVAHWVDNSPLTLRIESRDGARQFGLEDAAEGFQLWLQLALLETSVALLRLALSLERIALLADLYDEDDEGHDVQRRIAALERVGTLLAQQKARRGYGVDPYFRLAALDLLQVVRSSGDGPSTRAADVPELLRRGLDVAALFGESNCYFIDEPERHLHPSVARRAASWLGEVMDERHALCVLTTHSVPFLNLGDQALYVYLWRGEGRTFSTRFRPDELEAVDQLSEEMGFDRGELLASIDQILFVEGRADQIVLEGLLQRELRRMGIAIVPIHGVGRLHRVAEAEALFRYTSAAIAVLVDNDVAGEVPELRNDPEKLEKALRDKRHTERQAVAQLLRTAAMAEREVEVVSIPTVDIFFLLDEGVIGERFPLYPGHDTALAEWRQNQTTSSQNIGYKRFLSEQYKIPMDLGTFAEVVEIMAERNIVPHALERILTELRADTT